MPPGPTISTSRASASRPTRAAISSSRPTSSADSDGRFPAAADRPRRDAIRDAQRRIVPEDLPFELLEPRTGIEAELVRQQGPDPLIRRQRVGLAPRAVERRDQQRPQALLERVRGRPPPPARRPGRRRRRAPGAPRAGSRSASSAPRRAAPGARPPSRRRPRPGGGPRGTGPVPTRSARRRRDRRRRRAAAPRRRRRAGRRARRSPTARRRAGSRCRRRRSGAGPRTRGAAG